MNVILLKYPARRILIAVICGLVLATGAAEVAASQQPACLQHDQGMWSQMPGSPDKNSE